MSGHNKKQSATHHELPTVGLGLRYERDTRAAGVTQKVDGKPKCFESIYKRTAKERRDFLRRGRNSGAGVWLIFSPKKISRSKADFAPTWETLMKKIPARNAGRKALNIENLRCATCSPQVWCGRWDLNPHSVGTGS